MGVGHAGRPVAEVEEGIIDQTITGKKIDTRVEVELSQPLGVAAWRTRSAVRNIRLRRL